MRKMTETNLQAALAGESLAYLKYLNFAERAEKEGLPAVARIFQAAAYAERIHASNHLRALGGLQNTAENLTTALAGENFEIEEMYPAYLAVAETQEEKSAARPMKWALEAEKEHARLFAAARQAVEARQDTIVADLWVCSVCGFTAEGDVPEVCPLCGARHDKFHKF